uniref:Uncharacterized protein n=1 Tax=Romanomermis culicivorax TaxID=13658 RepID=A0A915IWG2_ROMCU
MGGWPTTSRDGGPTFDRLQSFEPMLPLRRRQLIVARRRQLYRIAGAIFYGITGGANGAGGVRFGNAATSFVRQYVCNTNRNSVNKIIANFNYGFSNLTFGGGANFRPPDVVAGAKIWPCMSFVQPPNLPPSKLPIFCCFVKNKLTDSPVP